MSQQLEPNLARAVKPGQVLREKRSLRSEVEFPEELVKRRFETGSTRSRFAGLSARQNNRGTESNRVLFSQNRKERNGAGGRRTNVPRPALRR